MVFIINKKENGQTDKEVTTQDVYEEFDELRTQLKIKEFACKEVTRGYSFDEFPDIPAEGEYLKVVYSYQGF